MLRRFIAPALMTAAAAAAIAAAPIAAANPGPGIDDGTSVTINERPGHVSIQSEPPTVSDARSYGDFSSPAPFLGE